MRVWLTMCLLALTTAFAVGAPGSGMVLRVNGSEVVVNRGLQDGVEPGQHYTLMRSGEAVGEVEVTLVDPTTSVARVVSGSPQIGDVMRAGGGVPTSSSGPASAYFTTEQMEAYEESYQERFRSRTATREFTAVSQRPSDPGMDALGWMNVGTLVFSSFNPYGFVGSPQILASTALQAVSGEVFMGDAYQDAQAQITLTYWDETLVDSYSDYTAYRETRGNLQQMVALKSIIYSQKGVDQGHVFEVRIRNTGPVIMQLAPFNFHIFVLVGDQRLQAQRYDQVLDKALNPGEEVLGYVYFPRTSAGAAPVRVALEDILGNREEITFGR
ncbi:MAG: hypothetical protein AB1758_13220 [Candidatus Eremiobacterota bacterium]